MSEEKAAGVRAVELMDELKALLPPPEEAEGEKHSDYYDGGIVPVQIVSGIPSKPFGGATSFADYDIHREAVEVENEISNQTWILQGIINNIFSDCELPLEEKVIAIEKVAKDLAVRVVSPPEEKSLLDRAKAILRGGSGKASVPTHGGPTSDVSTWDAPAAIKRIRVWASSDGSGNSSKIDWAKYIKAFAVVEGDGKKLGDFGFAHHDVKGGKLVVSRAGVVAGWTMAKGARSGQANADAQKHLNPHREQFGFKDVAETGGAFFSQKEEDGSFRFFVVYSNKFRDREGEILPEVAHKTFVEWVNETKEFPSLRLWHVEGSEIGQVDWIEYTDGFAVASGTSIAGKEAIFEALAEEAELLGVSHGFRYLEDQLGEDGVYGLYKTFEISILPLVRAANPWTAYAAEYNKEVSDMGFEEKKRTWLVGKAGEERVKRWEDGLEAAGKSLADAGIQYKDIDDVAVLLAEYGKGSENAPDPAKKDEGPPDPPPASEAITLEGLAKSVASLQSTVGDSVEATNKAIGVLATVVKDLKENDDLRLAELLIPSRPAPGQGDRPSQDPENKLDKGQDLVKDLEGPKDYDESDPIAPHLRGLIGR